MSGPASLGIVELVGVSDRLASRFEALAEVLGRWATDDIDLADDRRRRYATMCHRHAWHAELWCARRPAIAVDAPAVDVPFDAPYSSDDEWYGVVVDELEREIRQVGGRADPDLDPSTHWAVRLTLQTLR